MLCVPAVLSAAPLIFSGQFDPLLAEFRPRGGDGSFVPAAPPWGSPWAVALYGSDSGQATTILTTVGWDVTTGGVFSFLWLYQTWDIAGPSFDRAGYFRGIPTGPSSWSWTLTQLSNNAGPTSQSGWVGGVSLNAGDRFGFYVLTTDDDLGRASLTIYTPEPASLGLVGLGLVGLGLWARRRRLQG
jgi:hypothetical protein